MALRSCVQRWEKDGSVSVPNRLLYARAFGIGITQLGPHPDGEPQELAVPQQPAALAMVASGMLPALPDAASPLLSAAPAMIYRGRQEPGLGDFAAVGQEVTMSAHDGSGYTEEYEDGIGAPTTEQLDADVVRLARLTDTGSPLPMFRGLRRVRDRIYRLLDRRIWPRQQTELHFLLGVVNGLMGINANRLGYPDAAEELLRHWKPVPMPLSTVVPISC